jgi:lysyl-tRNA synthetase class 2
VNADARRVFELRARLTRFIREFLESPEQRFMEVETPMMHPIPVAPWRVRSSRTTTRSTSTCTCASRRSCTSSA